MSEKDKDVQLRELLADVHARVADAESGVQHSIDMKHIVNAEYYRGQLIAYKYVDSVLGRIVNSGPLTEYVDELLRLAASHGRLADVAYEKDDVSAGNAHTNVAKAYAAAAEGLRFRLEEGTT